MAIFESLTEKLNHAFSKIINRGKLTSLEIKEAMRDVKMALLEADVNYLVVKKFISYLQTKTMVPFAIYRLIFGALVLILALTGIVGFAEAI